MSDHDIPQIVQADDDLVRLGDCPPGLFLFNGHLGFKSEYGGNDVFCADSGEYFWGGAADNVARDALMVLPLAIVPPETRDQRDIDSEEAADYAEGIAPARYAERDNENLRFAFLAGVAYARQRAASPPATPAAPATLAGAIAQLPVWHTQGEKWVRLSAVKSLVSDVAELPARAEGGVAELIDGVVARRLAVGGPFGDFVGVTHRIQRGVPRLKLLEAALARIASGKTGEAGAAPEDR